MERGAAPPVLLDELVSRRPLMPRDWQASDETREVLATGAVVAKPAGALACYIISMAREVSDVLAVRLLLKAAGGAEAAAGLPVAPLFETLDDLDRAPQVMCENYLYTGKKSGHNALDFTTIPSQI